MIKSALQIVVAIVIGLGVALTAKGEEFAQNGFVVALIASSCIFTLAELSECEKCNGRRCIWHRFNTGVLFH